MLKVMECDEILCDRVIERVVQRGWWVPIPQADNGPPGHVDAEVSNQQQEPRVAEQPEIERNF